MICINMNLYYFFPEFFENVSYLLVVYLVSTFTSHHEPVTISVDIPVFKNTQHSLRSYISLILIRIDVLIFKDIPSFRP